MSDHAQIRPILPLAASGALGQDQQRAVEEHAAACAECLRELEVFRLYAGGLRKLPQPDLPPGLLQRTTARLIQERSAAAERGTENLIWCLLGLFSWALGALLWVLVRTITGGAWRIFGMNIADALVWSSVSTILVWATAGVAVIALGKRSELVRRFA